MTSPALLNSSLIARRAARVAISVSAILALSKLFLYFATGLHVIALSAWDSMLDVVISFANGKVIHYSRSGADHDHPYGHGRAESLAALGQGCLIIGGGLGISASSIRILVDLVTGQPVDPVQSSWGLVIFFICAAMGSLFLTQYLKNVGRRLQSPALLGDAAHYQVDVLTNIATAVAIGLVVFWRSPWVDPIVSLLFVLYIFKGAWGLIRTSIDELMDKDIGADIKKEVEAKILAADPRIIDVHNMRGRKVGYQYFFDFHVTLPDNLSFVEVHDLVEILEKKIDKNFQAEVMIHADPASIRLKMQQKG